jgi:bifunctional NMN adenylyltransferase/nudix hydrolase
MKSTGVIIARFQTPYLHEGHSGLIENVRERHNKVVVVLGVSAVKGSLRNPLDFYMREKMVKMASPDVIVLPLADTRNDTTWSTSLDQLLSSSEGSANPPVKRHLPSAFLIPRRISE